MSNRLSIEITFPYSVAYRASFELLLRSPIQLLFSILFPLAGAYWLYLWTTHNHELGLSDILLLIVCFFFTPITTALSLFMVRRRNPLTKGPFQYTFDESGIHAAGSEFSMNIKWSAVNKVRISKRFLFFFIAPSRAHSIPIQQLNPGDLNLLKGIARANVVNKVI